MCMHERVHAQARGAAALLTTRQPLKEGAADHACPTHGLPPATPAARAQDMHMCLSAGVHGTAFSPSDCSTLLSALQASGLVGIYR
jgi:hypothetical protein